MRKTYEFSAAKPNPYAKLLKLVEFFDKHDMGDHWERLPKGEFKVNIKTRKVRGKR